MMINIFSTCALTGTQEIGQRTDHFTDLLNLSAKDSIIIFLVFITDSDVKLFRISNDCIKWYILIKYDLMHLNTIVRNKNWKSNDFKEKSLELKFVYHKGNKHKTKKVWRNS